MKINDPPQISEEKVKDKDKAFNKLKDLQALLKKEASLRELYTKTSEETKKSIEEECRKIYEKKLDVFFTLKRFNSKKTDIGKKFELMQNNSEHLKDLNNYIPKLLTYLWEDPKLMSTFLLNSKKEDVKEVIAYFVANNFYENILSFNSLPDNFMYLLSILCKKEISELKSVNDLKIFLEDTPCGCLMEQLINKIDIKSYFNNILKDIMETIELRFSDRTMSFSIEKIENNLMQKEKDKNEKKRKEKEKEKGGSSSKKKEEDDDDFIYRKNWNETPELDINNFFSTTSSIVEDYNIDEADIKNLFGKESSKVFSEKYSPELRAKDFIDRINSSKDQNFKDYLSSQLKYCKDQDDYFSNKTFMNKVFNSKISQKILNEYQLNFMKVVIIIKELFNKLLNDLHLLPYSIKCLCKIILILIRKKFPNIIACEENAFVAKFFFCKIFAPIFRDPGIGALINNFIISINTINNLQEMVPFIIQLVSGRLYREGGSHGDYTPFNWFFIEEMPQVLKFFDNLTKVELPKFIDDYINDKLGEDYQYNYFKENPDEYIFHKSICFNIFDIKCIVDNMQNQKDIIFKGKENSGFYKTFEKLSNKKNYSFLNDLVTKQQQLLEVEDESINDSINSTTYITTNIKEEIVTPKKSESDKKNNKSGFFGFGKKKKNKVEENKPKDAVRYFLISNLLFNDKYTNILNPTMKTYHYSTKELKECKNEEDILKNKIIKIKNFFSTLLCNYRQLIKTDFDKGTTERTLDILKELRSFMKSSNFVIDGSIPSEWYVTSLIKYLKNLPENITVNEYEPLFKELENDLNKSLKELDFETLSICLNKIKFVKKGIIFYQEAKEKLIDILLNNKVIKIVDRDPIKVEISFKYGAKKKRFRIKPLGVKEKQLVLLDSLEYNKQLSERVCISVKDFCKHFPNLVELQAKQPLDVFELQLELDVPGQLQIYFDNIKNYLLKEKKITDKETFNLIYSKIYDYTMSKIFNKIFPNEPCNEDNKIYQNTIRLSWVEPKHFIPGKKNYVYDSFLPDAIKNFDLLSSEKSPRKKFKNMSDIFSSIINLVRFNNDGSDKIGVDDQMPILNYTLIKAQPKCIFSICKFMEIYLGELKKKQEDNQLTQLKGICENLILVNNESLNGVSEEEYKKKCEESMRDSKAILNIRKSITKDLSNI